MLEIGSVNHIGIRISDKGDPVPFHEALGFKFESDVGFEYGHPVVIKHASGVGLTLLGPATASRDDSGDSLDYSDHP